MKEMESNVPAISKKNEISFAEFPITTSGNDNIQVSVADVRNPAAIIKAANMTIALAPDISDHLLSRIIQEVAHA